jgi:hypothetical protein
VDAPPLARLQHDQVQAEGDHAQFAPERLEALAAVAVQRRALDLLS